MKRLTALAFIMAFGASENCFAEELRLNGSEISEAISEKTFVQIEPATKVIVEQLFQRGGLTVFTANGSLSQGIWKVESDRYCSLWPPSKHWECYDLLRDGQNIVFVAKDGTRFVFRERPRPIQ